MVSYTEKSQLVPDWITDLCHLLGLHVTSPNNNELPIPVKLPPNQSHAQQHPLGCVFQLNVWTGAGREARGGGGCWGGRCLLWSINDIYANTFRMENQQSVHASMFQWVYTLDVGSFSPAGVEKRNSNLINKVVWWVRTLHLSLITPTSLHHLPIITVCFGVCSASGF